MSTKQRGDVEKVASAEVFRLRLNTIGNVADFTRDEFRRIWEAGCKEFGLGGGDLHREFVLKEERDTAWLQLEIAHKENERLRGIAYPSIGVLAEKDTEIARLKEAIYTCQVRNLDYTSEIARLKAQAGLHHVGPCSQYAKQLEEKEREIASLKATSHNGQPCYYQDLDLKHRREIARLRGWLERWSRRGTIYKGCIDGALDETERALAGERVPE